MTDKDKNEPPTVKEQPGANKVKKRAFINLCRKDTEKYATSLLRELLIEESRQKYPSAPYHIPPKIDLKSTAGLTRAVMTFLRLKGHHCERTANQGQLIDDREIFTDTVGITRSIGSVHRITSQGMKGTSDLKAIISGKFIAIEIKNRYTHDRQRPEQKEYQGRVEASGGIYLIVQDFASFVQWYETFTNSTDGSQ